MEKCSDASAWVHFWYVGRVETRYWSVIEVYIRSKVIENEEWFAVGALDQRALEWEVDHQHSTQQLLVRCLVCQSTATRTYFAQKLQKNSCWKEEILMSLRWPFPISKYKYAMDERRKRYSQCLKLHRQSAPTSKIPGFNFGRPQRSSCKWRWVCN